MRFPTEWRIFVEKEDISLEEDISRFISVNIKNLTIKEDNIMLEKCLAKKEEYVAKLEELKSTNIEGIVEAKLLEVKEQIRAAVIAEHEANIKHAEEKVSVIDEMIAEEEANITESITEEVVTENENIGG